MKVLVLGTGLMGRAIIEDLTKQKRVSEVVANDATREAVEKCKELVGSNEIRGATVDVTNKDTLVNFMREENFDVVVNALPPELSVSTLKTCLDAEVDAVDLTFVKQQLQLDEKAKEKGVTLVPGCGVAPGLSNMLAGYGVGQLDRPDKISIKVGGLPVEPKSPLEYRIVFHFESVWREYTQPARIVRNGEIKQVPPLSGVESFNFPKIEEDLECFYTNGITSLPYTFEEISEIEEKTIRYKSHVDQIRTLVECGLLDTEEIDINRVKITPREFLTKLLTPKLTLGEDERDLTVMRVVVSAKENRAEKRYTFELLDYYDEEKGITSMARTTGYTGSIVAQLLGRREIEEKGIVVPEKLGLDESLFQKILKELRTRGISIQVSHPFSLDG